jgi:DNA-3-methyladenine glycosylase II
VRSRAASTLSVRPLPPFRLDLTVWTLRRRARNEIDRWDGTTYRRIIVINGRPTELAVRQEGPMKASRVVVTATPSLRTRLERGQVRSLITDLLGLGVDLSGWYRMVRADRRLHELAHRFRGVKPPRFPTVFESLVTAVACQQLSLVVGLELLNRLAALCGVSRGAGARARYAFPAPRDVARLQPAACQAIGFSRQKTRAILELAGGIEQGVIDVEHLTRADDARACTQLRQLRGIGRWTAEYAMLRGLGRLNVFPGDDVGAQNSLARWLGRRTPPDYAGVRRVVERWQPLAGLVYFHLLLDGLSRTGALDPAATP